jgi:hypothetical protein
MSSIPIVVPSYRRVDTFAGKTQALLKSYGVDMKRLHLFVADEAERARYRKVVSPLATVVVAEPGMMAVRNFIGRYFPDGQPIICLDDDIVSLHRRINAKKHVPLEDFDRMADDGFAACEKTGARLWGIYPVLNPMFMKARVTSDLRYIVGCVWGCLNNPAIQVTTDDKEDFERSMLYYRADGAVVRLEYIAPKTAYYSEPGGMQVERTDERVRSSAVYLTERYPALCSLNTSKKSGRWEVRLKDKRLQRMKRR